MEKLLEISWNLEGGEPGEKNREELQLIKEQDSTCYPTRHEVQ